MKKIISWNVNGIRAVEKKGFFPWLLLEQPDILCLQETKAHPDQLGAALLAVPGYHPYFVAAEKKGYSGLALYSREKPLEVAPLGISEFDSEGRVMLVLYPGFILLNCYFPNSQEAGARLGYKLEFCHALQETAGSLVKEGKNILICGDFNIAHKPIDLENPKQNEKNPGYLPEERAWMDGFIGSGYRDTFRMFDTEPRRYSWWSYRFKAREKNVGWRIDYHCVNEGFAGSIASARILSHVHGSDHCPVEVELTL